MHITNNLNSKQLKAFISSVERTMPNADMELRGGMLHINDTSTSQDEHLANLEAALEKAYGDI